MDKLIEAITKEVRLHYGVDTSLPMPKAMQVNIEGRIKAYLADTLGIVDARTVVDSMQDRMGIALRQDERNGLVGRWYENKPS